MYIPALTHVLYFKPLVFFLCAFKSCNINRRTIILHIKPRIQSDFNVPFWVFLIQRKDLFTYLHKLTCSNNMIIVSQSLINTFTVQSPSLVCMFQFRLDYIRFSLFGAYDVTSLRALDITILKLCYLHSDKEFELFVFLLKMNNKARRKSQARCHVN